MPDIPVRTYNAGGQWREAEGEAVFEDFKPYASEVFARVTAGCAAPWKSWRASLQVANWTSYGLMSSILTGDTDRGSEPASHRDVARHRQRQPAHRQRRNTRAHGRYAGQGSGRAGPNRLADLTDVIWSDTTGGPFRSEHPAPGEGRRARREPPGASFRATRLGRGPTQVPSTGREPTHPRDCPESAVRAFRRRA